MLIAGQLNEKGRFKVRLKIVNDAIVFSFVMAIETQSKFYHRTECSILRGMWDDRFFYQVPPDKTYFVGTNERNKVGVRDSSEAKRKGSTKNLHVLKVVILELRALQYKYSNIMMPDFQV